MFENIGTDSQLYTVYDFEETLQRVVIEKEDIVGVLAAWGKSEEGWGEWDGGFVLLLKDRTFAKIEGWCDTSGWGCQDGAELVRSDTLPEFPADADMMPADLNKALEKPSRYGDSV